MQISRSLLWSSLLACSLTVHADPLNISQAPLTSGRSVPPNVVFILDDSGSMDFEVITEDFGNNVILSGAQPDGSNPNGLKNRDPDDDGTAECSVWSSTFNGYIYGVEFGSNTYGDDANDCNTADDEEWRFRNSDFNKIYFNPELSYEPWPGVDSDGNTFENIDITNAPDNPYNPQETIDLTQHNSNWIAGGRLTSDRDGDGEPDGFRFYTWEDTDNDGLFDNGEETEYQIGHITQDQIDAAGWTNPDGSAKTIDDMQQDFANWFGFWRSRELVARGALAQSIAEFSNMRIGYTTINTNAYNSEPEMMNPEPSSGAKRDLMNKLYGTTFPANGTPLRSALDGVGRYYQCSNNNKFNSGGDPGDDDCPLNEEEGICQQNYAILMTDGFYNGSFWARGNEDGDNDSDFDGGDFADSHSNTLGDIAMHYYENDLHGDLDDHVPATLRDEFLSEEINGDPSIRKGDPLHQHMKTHTISFGVIGNLDWDNMPPGSWPDPGSSNAAKIDDLMHAAYNGRGEYYNADNPSALVESILSAFQTIEDDIGTETYLAFSSGSVQTNTNTFAATYNTRSNTGTLTAHPLECEVVAGNSRCEVGNASWESGALIDSNPSSRRIVTYDPDAAAGIPFQVGSLTASQLLELNTPLPAGLPASFGTEISDERVAYLRGDQTNEGDNGDGWDPGEFRERASLLGDIVNSSPMYVGLPFPDRLRKRDIAPYPDTAGDLYSEFASDSSVASRTPMIYVGANDGMLHGFNAANGREVFAYIPSFLFPKLSELTDPNYNHKMYVDGTPTPAAAFVGGQWRTVLVGNAGAGGRGVYALDVTHPDQFVNESAVASKVMWEFSSDDDPDLGYTFSEPVIGMINTDDGGEKQWVAIFGNGYNSTGADGDAALFILKLNGPNGSDWTGDYIKISTGYGTAESADGSTPNGLGDIRAVDVGTGNTASTPDGTIDYVYAGDIQGNLYRFDLTATTWTNLNSNANAERIFQATDEDGNTQPITVRPVVVNLKDTAILGMNYTSDNKKDALVIFGTGSWMTTDDAFSEDDHTIYGVTDEWGTNNYFVTREDFFPQSFSRHQDDSFYQSTEQNNQTGSSETAVGVDNAQVNYRNYDGWYMDLQDSPNPYPGERAIGRYELVTRKNDVVVVTSSRLPIEGTCAAGLEGGFIFGLDAINGGRPEKPFFDLNNDGEFDPLDNRGQSDADIVIKKRSEVGPTTCIGAHCYTGENFDYHQQDREGSARTGRLSWQEIFNIE